MISYYACTDSVVPSESKAFLPATQTAFKPLQASKGGT